VEITSPETDPEMAKELHQQVPNLVQEFLQFETMTLLSGHYDLHNALLTIHAGTGGVDAQDWAHILFRMYSRFTEKNNFKVQLVDWSPAEEAGIKTVTLEIKGDYAYGMLKSESGVHRLVRISPFNAKHSRETSFALIEVIPVLEDTSGININPDDLKIDVFRAGGHGGQGVNTTDSAVRITHIPTGIVVQCQNERSQLQNKDLAMKTLKNRLMAMQLAEKQQELKELKGSHQNSWGHQIRSYVMHPYTMVKDHRTNVEMTDVNKVLDGDILPFIEGYLRNKD
jgi:peptide chain release factor 2